MLGWRHGPPNSAARDELSRCLEEHSELLLDSITMYVYRVGLARGGETRVQASEILQEVVVEAMAHAERFEVGRRPLPWLLGTALNIIKRRKREDAKRAGHEFSASTLTTRRNGSMPDMDPLEQAADAEAATQLARVEDDAEAEALLALVPESDREVLRLAILEGWDRESLARRLGTSPPAARVRLHRAIVRLRTAWFAREANGHKEEPNE